MKRLVFSMSLLAMVFSSAFVVAGDSTVLSTARVGWPAPLSQEETWKLLPMPSKGAGQALPTWARMMVGFLPRGTAALLELDRAHRMDGPVDPSLRAAMRWEAAHQNRCDYGMQMAAADAARAGDPPSRWIKLIAGDDSEWSTAERKALRFARAMASDSAGYPDSDFAELVELFDERQAAAMVLHMAFANFQDRLLVCLGAPLEESPLPPVTAVFSPDSLVVKMPSPSARRTQTPAEPAETGGPDIIADGSPNTWLPYPELQERLAAQRKRTTRLRIPEWSEFAERLPEGLMEKPSDIVWYRIAFGYADELAVPFEIYMRTSGAEISQNWDRIFGNSMFWMVTDAMKCPYCMGHCEMNWEVVGLDADAIARRSEVLAGADWSMFTAAEQRALAFARKLTKTPGAITQEDVNELRKGFGDERAMFLMANASRYNYMTRISNGFQLTLESTNVFWDYYRLPTPEKSAGDK